jgi:hypothetical protein
MRRETQTKIKKWERRPDARPVCAVLRSQVNSTLTKNAFSFATVSEIEMENRAP